MNSVLEVTANVGVTLYAMIRRKSDGFVWNTALNAGAGDFEAWNAGNWAQYAVPYTEQATSGYYTAVFPAGIGDVFTSEVVYMQAGGSPAAVDAPPFILSLSQGQGVSGVNGSGVAASNMGAALATQQAGAAVGAVPDPLQVTTDLASTVDDAYLGRVIIWTTGAMAQQAARVSAYDGATKVVSVLAWPSALTPADGDEFIIV